MKKCFFALLLALVLLIGMILPVGAVENYEITGYGVPLTEETVATEQKTSMPHPTEVYNAIIAKKSEYPEGMTWTNANFYAWHGGIYAGGYGCAGFAFLLSDAAFGSLPARMLTSFSYGEIRVGDVLRINNDSHSVIVLEVHYDYVIVAEGNYNNSIHWGRTLTKEQVLAADHVLTRYPVHNHQYVTTSVGATCTEPGVERRSCSLCGVFSDSGYTEPLGHDWDWGEITQWPAEWTTGMRRYTCRRCGEYDYELIPSVNACPAGIYPDIPEFNNWAHDGIDYCVEESLMNGMPNGLFMPDGTLTRAQLVTILWRAAGEPEPEDQSMSMDSDGNVWYGEFHDNAPDQWYTDAIIWANENGIVTGYPGNVFKPENPITREQIATILYRYLGASGAASEDLAVFPDARNVSGYAYDAMCWAVEEGLIKGVGSGNTSYLRPQYTATRAQIATIIMRALSA